MKFRILSIDYGNKRTGLAISDQLQFFAISLPSIKTKNLICFLNSYIYEKNIQKVIIGEPKNWKNSPSEIEKEVQNFINLFYIFFPKIHLYRIDERFTSKVAKKTLVYIKKKYKTNKSILDQISATLILQLYLDNKKKYL